jgi:phage I-like protein
MLQLVERGFFRTAAIKLSTAAGDAVNPDVQVLRTGRFNHPKYGEFEITEQTLAEMKENFDNDVRGVDIAFDYFHESDKEASGWPTELYLSDDGAALWAKVDWTSEARKKLAEREIRYFSPDFAFEWEDPESGVSYKNVLFGGGLTNRPFVKDMAAIVAAENEREQMTLKEIQEKLTKLAEENTELRTKILKLEEMSDDEAGDEIKPDSGRDKSKEEVEKLAEAAAAKKGKKGAPAAESDAPEIDADDSEESDDSEDQDSVPALKKQLAEMQKKCAEYEEKFNKANAAKQMAEREKEFNVLLTEGKACVAQKKSFLLNDMKEFIKLAQPLNMEARGNGSGTEETTSDRDEKVLKLAEEMVKKDSALPLHKAIGLANKQIK